MGYRFVIGRGVGDQVVPCEGEPAQVHTDEWADDGPKRLPSYVDWQDVTDELPCLGSVFRSLEAFARAQRAGWIPCRSYEDVLPLLETEASRAGPWAGARALWFVRWSREALRRYGDEAAFETPGEWQ